MAWISVYDTVVGGKLRGLAKEIGCSENEALGLLVRFWLWGLDENTNPDGLILNADRNDIADVLRVGMNRDFSGEQAVSAMIATKWIEDKDGQLYIHDWKEWQRYWFKTKKIKQDDKERKARERAEKAQKKEPDRDTHETGQEPDSSDSKHQDPTNHTSAGSKKPKNDFSADFEEFWACYPRKVGKGDAYKCYKARCRDGWKPEQLLEAARNYAQRCERRHTEEDYIKHPSTFLSKTTPFTDFIRDPNGDGGTGQESLEEIMKGME